MKDESYLRDSCRNLVWAALSPISPPGLTLEELALELTRSSSQVGRDQAPCLVRGTSGLGRCPGHGPQVLYPGAPGAAEIGKRQSPQLY